MGGAFLGTTQNTVLVSYAGSSLQQAGGVFYRDVLSLWLPIGLMLLSTPGGIYLDISALQLFLLLFLASSALHSEQPSCFLHTRNVF